VHSELVKAGLHVSRRRVARLMRVAGLRGRVVRIYKANPRLHGFFTQHPNRLPDVGPQHPDQVWVGDITYLAVAARWWFLAVVMDQHSRRVVAWSLAPRRDARLTCAVLNTAVRRRRPRAGLIFHSDRGTEYSASAFRDRLRALGIRQSSARRGPSENSHMEPFFHSLKAELFHGSRFDTPARLRRALQGYIDYYNRRRAHSALGFLSPVDYELKAA
jgi:putative transposase